MLQSGGTSNALALIKTTVLLNFRAHGLTPQQHVLWPAGPRKYPKDFELKTLRYGIIGCGMMGREHVRNVALLEDAKIGAVFDPVAELAKEASQLAGGAVITNSLAELVNTPSLDALIVASPNF